MENKPVSNNAKKKKLLSVVILLTIGITTFSALRAPPRNSIYNPSIFTLWNSQKTASRKIANFLEPKYDIELSLETLSQEILEHESELLTEHNLKGSWKGVELSKLNAPQARLLVNFGHLIGDQSKSENFKHCSDAICILNSIYKDSSKLSGNLTYFWYLKTGSMLSLSNVLPEQKSKYPGEYNRRHFQFKHYLFEIEELKKFYKLAKTLPAQFLHNPQFQSIHKIPKNFSVLEGIKVSHCTRSLQSGQILINAECTKNKTFFTLFTSQIANFIDKSKGLETKITSISTSKEWKQFILWSKEEFWDNFGYKQKWTTHFEEENFLSSHSSKSPTHFLTELIASYRYQTQQFKVKVPKDIQNFISKKFFFNESFDDYGLYKSFLTRARNQWNFEEENRWSKCLETNTKSLIGPNTIRDLASEVVNPIFLCLEKEASLFSTTISQNLQKEDYEARYFFQSTETSALRKNFNKSLLKLLKENIIQRKVELKQFGEDVITAQKLKVKFFNEHDITSIYIKCFQKNDEKLCYQKNLSQMIKKFLFSNTKIDKNYQKIFLKELLLALPHSDVAKRTNQIAKRFLHPYQIKIKNSARKLWSNCQESAANRQVTLSLPFKFSANKYFMDAGSLNCINSNLDNVIGNMLNSPIKIDNNTIYLNNSEKKFLSFYYEQYFVQIFNNYLLEDVANEKNYLKNYFNSKKGDILYQLGYYTPIFLENAQSKEHFHKLCVEKVSTIYPENYHFHTKKELDHTYGRKICSDYSKQPKIAEKQKEELKNKWSKIISKLERQFRNEFQVNTKKCTQTYTNGLKEKAGIDDVKFHCKEIAYKKSLQYTLNEWRDFEEFEYLPNQDEIITSHFNSKKEGLIK